MPELLLPIFVFYLIYLYFTMKKQSVSNEKPVSKSNVEQPVATVTPEAKAKKTSSTVKTVEKAKAVTPKPPEKAQTEPAVAAVSADEKTVKPNQSSKAPKKSQAVTSKQTTDTSAMSQPERVGLTAGSIWHYLSKNGSTSVAKLVRELPEEEKIIQRSIGWLAQEGKITLDIVDRVETIGLTS
ncbi:MAG: winged helix-turn-helix domain-containing protein [Methylococcaceae bacterium]|nr:winged helix-turn-helix domain-containing protein [Methylococcaceae bacterium]